MTAYLDSSLVLQYILKGESAIRHALEFPQIVSSELLDIECRRVFFRCRLAGELDDDGFVTATTRLENLIKGMELIELSRPVRQRARQAFPLNVRTLDALHLSTVEVVQKARPDQTILVFSQDRAMNLCAKALGFGAPLL